MSTRILPRVHRPAGRSVAQDETTRIALALAMASFLGALAFVAPPPLFPAMEHELGVGVPLLGQVISAMLLLGAGLALVVGPLADQYGHRRLLVIGATAAAGCLLGFGLVPVYPALLVAAMLGGLANATLPGLSLAVARTAFAGAAQRQAIGWATAGGAGAAVIGVPLLAALAATAGWRAAFIAAGIVALGVTWLIGSSLPAHATRSVGAPQPNNLLTAYGPLLRHRPTQRLYAATVLRSVCWSGLVTYFGALLGDGLGFGSLAIGSIYMFGGVAYVASSIIAGYLPEGVRGRPMVVAMNLGLACTVGLTFSGAVGTIGTAMLLPLAGFAGGAGWVGMVTLLAEQAPGGAGTSMALNTALLNLGAAGGSALGGALLAVGGYEVLGLALPGFALGAALLVGHRGPTRMTSASPGC